MLPPSSFTSRPSLAVQKFGVGPLIDGDIDDLVPRDVAALQPPARAGAADEHSAVLPVA